MNESIIGILSFFSLWLMYVVLWKDYCIDCLRENLFILREELFDTAIQYPKDFNFKDSMYRSFERAINGTIKVAEGTNSLELFWVGSYLRRNKLEIKNYLDFELENFSKNCNDKEVVAKILKIRENYHKLLINYLMKTSSISGMIFVFLDTFMQIFERLSRKKNPKVSKIFISYQTKGIRKNPMVVTKEFIPLAEFKVQEVQVAMN